MLANLQKVAKRCLPRRYQVPARYWYRWCQGRLEVEMQLLATLIRPGDRVLDIGGNRGVYTYRFWRLGAKVEVFEPNPVCCDVISIWAAGKSRVQLHPVALSNREGRAELHIPIDRAGIEHDASASIETGVFDSSHDQLVAMQTLDSFHFQGVTLVKIDVEGHEASVIEGACSTLTSSKPAILVEIEQRHNQRPIKRTFDMLASYGYEGFFLLEGRLVSVDKFDVSKYQSRARFGGAKAEYLNNFLFLNRDSIANGRYKKLIQVWG